MSRKVVFGVVSVVLVGLLVAALVPSFAVAQEDADAAAKAELEAYLKASQPGPEHAKLRMRVGNWKIAGTFYMAPDAPPMKSEASATIRQLMGGRYIRESYTGEFMGQKFTGIGVAGYDKDLKKYVSTWIDSMSSGIMRSEGEEDAAGNLVFKGEYFDGVRNAKVRTKYVLTLTSRKTHTAAMYEVSADGNERKVMELVYTRVKRQKGAKKQGTKKQAKKKGKDA